MKKIVVLIVILLSFTAGLFFIQSAPEKKSDRLHVAVSTFALYDIVKHLGGEKVAVKMVIPFGVEVHSFEPTPKTIIEIQKSALFLYSGASLEPWVKKLAKSANMMDMSRYVDLRTVSEHEDDHDEHAHHHGQFDPHYWLDIKNMKLLSKKIAAELGRLDPNNRDYYLTNASAYIKALDTLEQEYDKGLKVCELHEVIVHHNILGYLAPEYHFHVSALSGLSPDALTNAQTMAELSKTIRKKGIDVIFFEAFVSDRMIQSLAKENKIRVDSLEPLANITAQQAQEKMSYVEGMRSNLKKLSRAMRCR